MKTTASYIRVILFMTVAWFLMEFTIDSGDEMAVVKYPIIWAVLALLLLFSVAIEITVQALKSILFRGLSPEAQEKYLENEAKRKEGRFSGIKRLYKKLLGSKPIEEEHEIILDHNYDGIKELDNRLPPWWVYGFYITIIFAVVYMARYHIFGGVDQVGEYEIKVEQARLAIEEYKRTAKDLVDVNTVELLTDPADLSAGQAIFNEKCMVCHKADGGGGIGPNLTDEYWILGGGIINVFKTISEGGRDGKGMISWKNEMKPSEMAQVASFILSLQGTTPAEPKAPEGEIWVDPDALFEMMEDTPTVPEETQEAVIDSTTVTDSIQEQ